MVNTTFTIPNYQSHIKMKKFIALLIFSVLVAACGSKQPKPTEDKPNKVEPVQTEPTKPASANEYGMWKIAKYASNLGNNRNTQYITNSYAIWGTFTDINNDNAELKVKFLVDKETFCIKLMEYGTKVVKKGDESCYKIKIKFSGNELTEFTAKNVSDRLFINGKDSQKIIDLFGKGGVITFSMVTDSKTSPASYAFIIDKPEGFGDALKKILN